MCLCHPGMRVHGTVFCIRTCGHTWRVSWLGQELQCIGMVWINSECWIAWGTHSDWHWKCSGKDERSFSEGKDKQGVDIESKRKSAKVFFFLSIFFCHHIIVFAFSRSSRSVHLTSRIPQKEISLPRGLWEKQLSSIIFPRIFLVFKASPRR